MKTRAIGPKYLVLFATVYRLVLLVFQYAANLLFDDFDTSTWIDDSALDNSSLAIKSCFLNGLQKWDAVYFTHIAQYGYTYEQMLAFFPCFPYMVSTIASFVNVIFNVEITATLFQWITLSVNFLSYLLATVYMFYLTVEVTNKHHFASLSALLFIVNPANVFMMSSYTESLFAFLQFGLFYHLEKNCFSFACLYLTFSILTRSNGMLGSAFFLYFYLKHNHHEEIRKIIGEGPLLRLLAPFNIFKFASTSLVKLSLLVVSIVTMFLPYVFKEIQTYNTFCKLSHYNQSRDHWCDGLIPMSYSYTQDHYWNVGLFRYWEIKQLPNFLLAFPVVIIVFYHTQRFLVGLKNFDIFLTFGILKHKTDERENDVLMPPSRLFVYLCHCLFLTCFGLIGFHVQILTRMLFSSSPVLYWAGATIIIRDLDHKLFKTRLIIGYFFVYNVIGVILHCNFYPWT